MAPHASLLDLIRRAIQQQTTRIGATVSNLTGAVPGQLDAAQVAATQRWGHASVPANALLDLSTFYTVWQTAEAPRFSVLEPTSALPGTVYFVDPAASCHLLAAGLAVPSGVLSFSLGVETEDSHALWGVYVDGTLVRRGAGAAEVPLALPAGAHALEVVLYAAAAVVRVPAYLPLTADFVAVATPTLTSVTTAAADAVTGATSCQVTWVNDPKVGGVRVLRREQRPLAAIVSVGELQHDRTFAVNFAGNVVTDQNEQPLLTLGEELYVADAMLGVIRQTADTTLIVTLAPDQAAIPEGLVGQLAWVGQWQEQTRQARSVAGGTSTFEDRGVRYGGRYEYCVQAWSVWNPLVLSAFSASLSVRAGDIEPPGCIQVLGASAVGDLLELQYHTPSDEDYAGANVYATLSTYGVVVEATTTSVTLAPNPDVDQSDGALVGWTVEVDEQLRVITTFASLVASWSEPLVNLPLADDVVVFTNSRKVVSDFGLPNSDDSVTLAMPGQTTTYEFRAFDRSRNEQNTDDMVLCPGATFVFVPGEFNRPTVYIDELTASEQANFPAPYNNPRAWSVVLIGAKSVLGETTGVTISVQRRNGAVELIDATLAPTFELLSDNPPVQNRAGPYTLVDSRYYALERTTDINWIVVTAQDGRGNESREYYYATSAPFVRMPEVTVTPSETATDAVLDVWVYDPDARMTSVEFATQSGVEPFSAYADSGPAVETQQDGTRRRYRVTAPFVGGLTTRIAYRVNAQLYDSTVGQIAQGVIPYTLGSAPGLPQISGTFDALDGSLQLQLAADSDTKSLQWYVLPNVRVGVAGYEAQREPGGPWLPLPTQGDLATIFATPNLTEEADGRFIELDTNVVLQPGDRVWVAARSCNVALSASNWPGVVSESSPGTPAFASRLFTREGTYIPPKIRETIVESIEAGVPTATLTIGIDDPQGRLRVGSGVVFRRMPGSDPNNWDAAPLASWYSPVETSSGNLDTYYEYAASVRLYEGQLSQIAYAVIGEDEQGDNDAVLELRTVNCGLGTTPMIPQVSGVVDGQGRFALTLLGDSDTVGFRYAFAVGTSTALPDYPLLAAVEATALVTGRTHTTNTLATVAEDAVVAVMVLAYNRDGIRSEPFQAQWARNAIYIAPDVEEFVDETTDLVDGTTLQYGVLQLRVRDPQARVQLVEFSSLSGNDPENWERTWDGSAWVTTWNAPLTSVPEDAQTTNYTYQVRLVEEHLSRVQYRVRGVRADGSVGVLFQSSVAFDIGAKPTILELGGHIDGEGRYWPTFRGDSDCRSWVVAVRVGTPSDSATAYPTRTDVESPANPNRRVYLPPSGETQLREYPDPDGTPAPDFFRATDDEPVIVQPGRMLFVTAMALATNDGGAPSNDYKSALRTYTALRAAPYVPPQVRIDATETATSGTLQVFVTDPSGLLDAPGAGVYFRKMAGRESTWESGYSAYAVAGTVGAEDRYEATVTLPDLGAKIGYQVRAAQADGTVGIVQSEIVTFNPNAVPTAPVVQLLIDNAGTVRAVVNADSDTTHLKVVFAVGTEPTESAVNAATAQVATPGQNVVTWGTTVGPLDVVHVAVKAQNQSVTEQPLSALVRASGDASVVYVRPVAQETTSETDKLGTLTLSFVDPQAWLRSVTLKKQTGAGTWSTRSVVVDTLTPSVQETVDLAARKTSRIQYELQGIREDGSLGLIGTALVSFRPGATPDVPQLAAFISANGQLTVDVVGDSDTLGARLAVRKSGTALIKSDVLGGTNPSGILRSVQGGARVLRWVVPTVDFDVDPGDLVSIGAVAYPDAACSDDTLSSDVATTVVTRNSAYQAPLVELTPSETATVGSLSVGLTDPQLHVVSLEAQTKAGRNAWTGWTTVWTRGVSTATTATVNVDVALVEGINSYTRIRAYGMRADGTTGVIAEHTMPFSAGIQPATPEVTVDVLSTGAVNVTFTGDSDTTSFRYGVTTLAANSSAAAIGTAANSLVLGSTVNGRVARVNAVGTASGANGVLVVAQAASGANGLGQLSTTRAYALAQPPSGLTGVTSTLIRLTNITPTTVTMSVTCTNGGQVRWITSSNVTNQSGASLNTWTASGSTWVFDRHPTAAGAVDFEGGNVSGYANSRDTVYIPAQSEVTKPPLRVLATMLTTGTTPSTVSYSVTVVDDSAGTTAVNVAAVGDANTGNFSQSYVGTSGISATVGPITLPAIGSAPGVLRITATATGYYPDTAILTIPARETLPPPTFRVETSESTDTAVVRLRSYDPYTQVGNVQFRTRSGAALPDTWTTDWATVAGTAITDGREYEQTVLLAQKRMAIIEWRAYDSTNARILEGNSLRFSPTDRPAVPEITVTVNEDGTFNVELQGDTDTVAFQYGFALSTSNPTPPVTIGPVAATNNRVRLTNLGGANYVGLGKTVVVSAQGLNTYSAVGPVAYGLSTTTNKPTTGKSITLSGSDFQFGSATGTKSGRFITLSTGGTIHASAPIGNSVVLTGMTGRGGYLTPGGYSIHVNVGTSLVLTGTVTVIGPGFDNISSGASFYTIVPTALGGNVNIHMTLPAAATLEYVTLTYNAPSLDNSV